MGIIFKMAWRNIWRNKRRTIILLCAVSIGLIGMLFISGFMNGWMTQMLNNAVRQKSGHVAIMAKGFYSNPVVENHFTVTDKIKQAVENSPEVTGWTTQIVLNGLVNNADKSRFGTIIGADTKREPEVFYPARSIVEGRWLNPDDRYGIVVGHKLLETYNTKLGRKIVLMTQQFKGDVGSGAFHIIGVYRTENNNYDESNVYITQQAAKELANLGDNQVTNLAMILENEYQADAVKERISTELNDPQLEILTWRQLQPMLRQTLEMMDQFNWITYLIFYIAMAFGILNTLLMAVNERYREIGIMIAIGTSRLRVVVMVAVESLCIALVAVAIGDIIGVALVELFHHTGMNLSLWSDALEGFNVGRIIYPYLGAGNIWNLSMWTFVFAMLSAIIPAFRAARFKPVEAIRTV